MSPDMPATVSSGTAAVLDTDRAEKSLPVTVKTSNPTATRPERSRRETKPTRYSEARSYSANGARSEKSKAARGQAKGVLSNGDKKPARLVFREIPVVVRIEGGRVAEAYIRNGRADSEGYEATALRVARQRRYPRGKIGLETIIVQVANEH
jgi:hypothetical protein